MPRKGFPHVATTFPLDEGTGTRPVPRNDRGPGSACTFARRLLDGGRAAEAMEILEADMDEGKDSAEFQFLLGRAAFRLGHHVQAHRAFSRAVSLSPQDAEVYRWLARLLLRRDNALGAMRALEWTSRSTIPEAEGLDEAIESPFDSEPDTVRDHLVPAALQLDTEHTRKGKSDRRSR